MIGRSLPGKDELAQENQFKAESDEMMIFRTLIQLKSHQEEIPVCFFLPRHWNKQVAIWITDQGKQKLVNDEGTPHREVKQLLNAGISVVIPDLLYQGDFLEAGQPLAHSRAVKNNSREFVGYTLGYNHPLFAQRVHDVLTLIAFCRFSKYEPEAIHLIGLGRVAGPIVAAAAAQAPGSVKKIAIGTNGFRFQSLTDAYDPSLLPGAVKYGDVPGLLGLLAKHSVWLSGEKAVPQVTQKCFAAAGSGSINLHQGAEADELSQAASWIAKNE